MTIIDWNDLSSKEKLKLTRFVFVPGPCEISQRRVKQLLRDFPDKPILFGCLKDEWIPGLENMVQFEPLRLDVLKKSLRIVKNATILYHFHKDLKYIIRELTPIQILWINGSWSGPIHYRSEYWEALKTGSKVQLVSRFADEKEAHICEKEYTRTVDDFIDYQRRYTPEEIVSLCRNIGKISWDWIGQVGACLVDLNGYIKAAASNYVLPYQAYQMMYGSIRERDQIPSQEMIELQQTNHAECELLEIARTKNLDLGKLDMYVTMFPCPVCAKIIARTPIKSVIYSSDHNSTDNMGYRILDICGKKLIRLVRQRNE